MPCVDKQLGFSDTRLQLLKLTQYYTVIDVAATMDDAHSVPSSRLARKRKHSDAKLLSATKGTAKLSGQEKQRLKRYERGPGNKSRGVVKHRLKLGIKRGEKKMKAATKSAAQAEILLPSEPGVLEPENEMERTARYTQRQIAAAVDQQTQRKAYNMTLDRYGPYRAAYTSNGRHLLLGGGKGHIAILDWENCRITREMHVKETVRCRSHGGPLWSLSFATAGLQGGRQGS